MDHSDQYNFYSFFKNLAADCLTQREINIFIEKSMNIAVKFVMMNYGRIRKILIMNKFSAQDVAIDSIAPLFETRGEVRFYLLKESAKIWNPPIKNNTEALFMFSKLLELKVKQHIGTLLKETDPAFNKILDSVRYFVRKGEYHKKQIFGRWYIVEAENLELNSSLIDSISFRNLPAFLFDDSSSLLENLFSYLKEETEYYPAIPVNQLVNRLKELSFNELKIELLSRDHSTEIETEQILEKGYESALEKLNSTYLVKKKLTKKEAGSFKGALKDISNDLKFGYTGYGLFDYLKPHFPGLGKKRYRGKYQNMLEYLTKVMKSTIYEQLIQNN